MEEVQEDEEEVQPASPDVLEQMVDTENREAKRRKVGLHRYFQVKPKKE